MSQINYSDNIIQVKLGDNNPRKYFKFKIKIEKEMPSRFAVRFNINNNEIM